MSRNEDRDRLLDLLSDQICGTEEPIDSAKLTNLLSDHPDVQPAEWDLAAASIQAAFADLEEETVELPASLERSLKADAARLRSFRHLTLSGGSTATPRARSISLWATLASVAAVASIIFAFSLFIVDRREQDLSMSDQRRALIASAPDLSRANWEGQVEGFKGVHGDVVWSDERQQGYMRLRGLRANDPTKSQYQLWIVDPDVDKHPVDGGVFDVRAGSNEVIIPIRSALAVSKVAVFALTEERVGGVVVSAGPLLVTAVPGK